MIDKAYYYCPVCNKAVPRTQRQCDCRRTRMGNVFYTLEEVNELIAQNTKRDSIGSVTSAEAVAAIPEEDGFICSGCGKTYDIGGGRCTECGQLIVPLSDTENGQTQLVQQQAYQLQSQPAEIGTFAGMNVIDDGMPLSCVTAREKGLALSAPIWKLDLSYFMDGKMMNPVTVELKWDIFEMGRNCLPDYFADIPINRMKYVSRVNAYFITCGDELYIQYYHPNEEISRKKVTHPPNRIYKNNIPIEREERIRLESDDVITMGGRINSIEPYIKMIVRRSDSMNITAQMDDRFKFIAQQNMYLMKQNIELRQDISDMHDDTKKDLSDIKFSLDKLDSLVKSIERGDDIKQIILELSKEIDIKKSSSDYSKTDDEAVEYLLSEYDDAEKIQKLMYSKKDLKDYIIKAGHMKWILDESGMESSIYTAVFVFLEQLFESFAHQFMLPLFKKTLAEQWDSYMMRLSSGINGGNNFMRPKNPDLGNITLFMSGGVKISPKTEEWSYDEKNNEVKNYIKQFCPRVYREKSPELQKKVRNVMCSLDFIRELRNHYTHTGAGHGKLKCDRFMDRKTFEKRLDSFFAGDKKKGYICPFLEIEEMCKGAKIL